MSNLPITETDAALSDRPTPETDAEHAQFRMGGFTLDFCRKLERERDEAREGLEKIKTAAQAVVNRWEQPSWKDAGPTAAVIYRLRNVIQDITGEELE